MEMQAMHIEHARKNTTAESIVYLLLSFPLGLIYFLITVIGLSVGLGTIVIWIGLPILFVTLVAIRGMAALERQLVVSLLRFPIPSRPARNSETRRTFIQYLRDMLRDQYTWTGMLYMILKLPLGIFSFTLALVLPIVATATALLPLAYLINLFVNAILLKSGIDSTGYIIPYFIEVHGTFDLVMFLRSFIGVPIGILLWFVTSFVLNGLAIGSGELARALLGPVEAAPVAQTNYQTIPPMPQPYEQQAYESQAYEQQMYITQEQHS